MGGTSKGEVSWSCDMAEGTLPQKTVLFKVMTGFTLEATLVVEDPRVAKSSSRSRELHR